MAESPATPQAIVGQMMANDAFSQWLGIEVLTVDAGHVTLRMTVRDEMTNGFGIGHGGILYALADSALAFASNGYGQVALALENVMHYTEPARVGDVVLATATERSRTRRIGVYDVALQREDGTDLALFRGTVYITARLHEAASSETKT